MPLSPHLRDRILRQLDQLSDDKAYHLLDYAEFLSSKYAERSAPAGNLFTKFTEGVEDTMRAGRVSTTAISETMGLLNKAVGVLNGVAAAGKSVASEIANAATGTGKPGTDSAPVAPPSDPSPPSEQ